MINLRRLEREQSELARKVVIRNEVEELQLIGGLDHSYFDKKIIAGIVVCKYPSLEVVERKHAIRPCKMPYIPGFLAYREMPAAAEAYSLLDAKPHVLMVDGNGILHPRGLGIASHFGVLQDIPTIGIAKNLFAGEAKEGKIYINGKVVGQEILTKESARPLFVSPGHRITLTKAVEIVKECIRPPHKLPEPLHLAHRYVRKIKDQQEGKIEKTPQNGEETNTDNGEPEH